jgi:6-phosphogluconolactonase (cycloisomerase 2 family)
VNFDESASTYDMTVDPLGRFVYVQAFVPPLGDSLTPLTFDSNSGTLARNAAAVSYGGGWVVADPHGKFLYAAAPQATPPTISVFSVSASNGALSAVSGATVTSTESSVDATIDPSGNYLFTANYNEGSVTVYAIDGKTGRLAAINGSPFPTGPRPMHVLVEPQGRFLYVSGDSGMSAFQIDSANGSLTAIAGSPFAFASLGGRILFSY